MTLKVPARFLFLAVASLAALSCIPTENRPELVSITGTVRQVDVDGGCWCIQSAEGKLFEITNLPDEYRSNGLAIRARIAIRQDLASTCMVGEIADVVVIERGG